MNGHPDLAREHMEKSISLLDQFNLLHINDSIPQIANYAMFLTEQQEPEREISELQKLSGIIKEYHSDDCLDYAKVQEIQKLYPQIGFSIRKTLSCLLTK